MKFFRFGSFAGIATITMMLLAGVESHAADGDEDIPLPQDKNKPAAEAPLKEPGPQEPVPMDEQAVGAPEATPQPSLGADQDLPAPKQDKAAEKKENVVNKSSEREEMFLPTPALTDNAANAPVGYTPSSGRVAAEDLDYRSAVTNRPVFMMHGGVGLRNYPSTLVTTTPYGYLLGGSIRLFNVAQTVFLHGYGSVAWYKLNQIGPFSNVIDRTNHLGAMLEIGLGRRLSLYGSLMRRWNVLAADAPADPRFLVNIGEAPTWELGAGLQYDFYVIPHGSIGALVRIEKDVAEFVLTMALEPQPKKKMQLNFDEIK
jgi:hypothetical protein